MNLAVTVAACASAAANIAVVGYLLRRDRRARQAAAKDETPRQFRRPVTPVEKV